MPETIHCKNYGELSRKAAKKIFECITAAKQEFVMAIPGGESVKGLLKELAKQKADWKKVHVFMTDERMVPLDDRQSNYYQAKKLWFSKAKGIHDYPFTDRKGVEEYTKELEVACGAKLDLVVLGVGEDGHIASLFPRHLALIDMEQGYLTVWDAPKRPTERISLTPKTIGEANCVILLFASTEKKEAYSMLFDDKVNYIGCPAKIALDAKKLFVYTVFGGANAK